MTSTDRLSRLNMLIFKQANIRKIQDAIKQLLDIFHDILEKDFEYGAYFNTQDVMQRLHNVDQMHWKEIRNMYLYEEYYGYCDGNFSDDEMNNPAKLIMDLLSILCKCREGILEKVQEKHHDMQQLEHKLEEMRTKTTDLYQQLLDEKRENADRKLEFAKLQGKVTLMEKMVEEKNSKITELLRDKNVQLNEKEKEKLLENANKKIEELEEQIMELQASKQRASRRLSCIDDQNKMLKLKQERLGIGEDCVDGEEGESNEVQRLKRDIYIKDKDIAHLEDQFYNEQKVVMGILGGIRTDINILSEKFYKEEEQIRDPDFVKLTKNVEKIFDGASEGKLASVRMMLPPHFTYFDKELKVRKLKRLSKQASLPSLKSSDFTSQPLPTIGASLGKLETIHSNGEVSAVTDTTTTQTTTTSIPSKKLASVSENPVIVDPHTGRINSMAYLMHFPHMAQNFVLDHWKKFKEYDTDHDCSLDLSEVSKILTSIGCQFTPDQIEEAIDEVDRDNNHTLDFFEYLLVLDKITKKSGKSKLFKTGLKQNKEVSKTCVIQ